MPGFDRTLETAGSAGSASSSLPFDIAYEAASGSAPGGYGGNPSSVGYRVTVSSPNGTSSVRYGTSPTDSGQGVPWEGPAGAFSNGRVAAWALDTNTSNGQYTVRIDYDRPVYGMRTAVTDLDNTSETITMNAFSSEDASTPIPLDDVTLDAPSTIPELAANRTHAGNTAFVVDEKKVSALGGNKYASAANGGVTDSKASVFFAYDSDEPVQRLEMTYSTNQGGVGFWFVPPSVPQACVQPTVAIDHAHQGSTTTLTSAIANGEGNGRVEDIGYTYRLPEGVVVADTPNLRPGCGATITAEPGTRDIVVSGAAVHSGVNQCDWSIDVTFVTGGTKTFDSSNILGASNLRVEGTKSTSIEVDDDVAGVATTMKATVRGGGAPAAGEELVYTATVENTGNAPLTELAVEDALGTGLQTHDLPVAPGASATFVSTRPHEITQAEVDQAVVRNTATATGRTAFGSEATASTGDVDTEIVAAPALSGALIATVHTAGQSVSPGDSVSYTATFTNTGNTTLSGLRLDDEAPCTSHTIAPGAHVDCELPSTELDQQQIDAGRLEREATLHATAPGGATVSAPVSTTTELSADARAELAADSELRDGGDGRADAGDTVVTSVSVHNDGNVTLSGLELDVVAGTELACPADIAPKATVECTSTRTLTQDDIDAGKIVVRVDGHATAPAGDVVDLEEQINTVSLPVHAGGSLHLEAVLEPGDDGRADAGDVVRAQVRVHNTGNVTLQGADLVMSDAAELDCSGRIAPGESTTCATTHVLTQADVDRGSVALTVTGSAATPAGRVDLQDAAAEVSVPAAPGAVLGVRASVRDGAPVAGDVVEVAAVVENTGNVTMREAAVSLAGDGALDCPTPIAPGARVDCVVTEHVLTQDDVDAGRWTASVKGTVGFPGDRDLAVGAESPVDLVSAPVASLDLHAVVDEGDDGRLAAGDVVRFTPVVRNDGNVTLHDIALADLDEGAIPCPINRLVPGRAASCDVVERSVTQEDMDRGQVLFGAHGQGTAPSGTAVEIAERTIAVELPAEPSLAVDAEGTVHSDDRVVRPDADGLVTVPMGATMSWTTRVRNTGTVVVRSLEAVADPALRLECEKDELAPGESTECTSERRPVKPADVAAGVVRETLHAEGVAGTTTALERRVPVLVTSDEVTAAVKLRAEPVPELAFTGADLVGVLAAGLALLASGTLLLVVRRRSRLDESA